MTLLKGININVKGAAGLWEEVQQHTAAAVSGFRDTDEHG